MSCLCPLSLESETTIRTFTEAHTKRGVNRATAPRVQESIPQSGFSPALMRYSSLSTPTTHEESHKHQAKAVLDKIYNKLIIQILISNTYLRPNQSNLEQTFSKIARSCSSSKRFGSTPDVKLMEFTLSSRTRAFSNRCIAFLPVFTKASIYFCPMWPQRSRRVFLHPLRQCYRQCYRTTNSLKAKELK